MQRHHPAPCRKKEKHLFADSLKVPPALPLATGGGTLPGSLDQATLSPATEPVDFEVARDFANEPFTTAENFRAGLNHRLAMFHDPLARISFLKHLPTVHGSPFYDAAFVQRDTRALELLHIQATATGEILRGAKEFEYDDLNNNLGNYYKVLYSSAKDIEIALAGTEVSGRAFMGQVADIHHLFLRFDKLYYRTNNVDNRILNRLPQVVLGLIGLTQRYRYLGENAKADDIDRFIERAKKRFDLPDDLKKWAQEEISFETYLRKHFQQYSEQGTLNLFCDMIVLSALNLFSELEYGEKLFFLRSMITTLNELKQGDLLEQHGVLKVAEETERVGRALGMI